MADTSNLIEMGMSTSLAQRCLVGETLVAFVVHIKHLLRIAYYQPVCFIVFPIKYGHTRFILVPLVDSLHGNET